MKKTTKALYSAVAGLALIASTGGATYATWIDRAPLGTTTDEIHTGNLRLDFKNTNVDDWDQVNWTLYNDQNQPIKWGNLTEIGDVNVSAGFRLVGTVDVRSTLVGDTLVANLRREFHFNPPTGTGEKLIAWIDRAAQATTVEIKDGSTTVIATNANTSANLSPVAAGYRDYTVTITIPFPKDGFPDNDTDGVWQAVMHMGDLNLELLQNASTTAFGR